MGNLSFNWILKPLEIELNFNKANLWKICSCWFDICMCTFIMHCVPGKTMNTFWILKKNKASVYFLSGWSVHLYKQSVKSPPLLLFYWKSSTITVLLSVSPFMAAAFALCVVPMLGAYVFIILCFPLGLIPWSYVLSLSQNHLYFKV